MELENGNGGEKEMMFGTNEGDREDAKKEKTEERAWLTTLGIGTSDVGRERFFSAP